MDDSLPELGDLEREVMQLVWANGPVTAEAVRERLSRPLKESTVRTVLRTEVRAPRHYNRLQLNCEGVRPRSHTFFPKSLIFRPNCARGRIVGIPLCVVRREDVQTGQNCGVR